MQRLWCCLLVLFYVFPAKAQSADTTASLTIRGEVLHPTTLKAADLASMKRVEITVKDTSGKDLVYSGVALSDL